MQSTWQQPPNQNPWQLGPTASRLARWVFGLGFFSVHLGIFLIGGLALLMINLYRSPDDLWVGGPLIRWGVIVLIHFLGAVITWAFTTAFDAAEATRRESAPLPRTIPASSRSAAFAPQRSTAQPPSYLMPPAEPQPARHRFSPARSTPATTIEVEARSRVSSQPGVTPPAAAPHRSSPPGWTVVRGDQAAASPKDFPPSDETPEEEVAEDARWTWVEAAAEAWLNGRNESPDQDSGPKPPTGGDPVS